MKYNDLSLGTIEAIVNKLGGMEGINNFLSGETLLRSRRFAFQTWKTIKLGLYKNKDAYMQALKEAGCHVNDGVNTSDVVKKTNLTVAPKGTELELVKVSIEELLCLDLFQKNSASFAEILKSAKKQGLCECPIEVAFALRLQHIEEDEYEQFQIVTEPIIDSECRPCIFEVSYHKALSKQVTNRSNFSYPFIFIFCRQTNVKK